MRKSTNSESAAPAHPCARGISASLHVTFGDDVLPGRRPRTAGDFCFGESTQSHFAPRFSPHPKSWAGNLGFRLPQWVRRRHIHDADDGRTACSAPLSLLSLASPGLAIRGEPVQRDKGPLDLCLDPLHPSRPPPGGARCTGMYECRECRMHTSGLRLHSSSARP